MQRVAHAQGQVLDHIKRADRSVLQRFQHART